MTKVIDIKKTDPFPGNYRLFPPISAGPHGKRSFPWVAYAFVFRRSLPYQSSEYQ